MTIKISEIIDLRIVIASMAVGLIYIYLMDDDKKVVILHPTPYNVKEYIFKDFLKNCYELNMKEVSCYENEMKIENLPKNDF
tara:strand:- start:919 stop:1164 length:246 start_codon:yes stop_codon:yes gene_type:complete